MNESREKWIAKGYEFFAIKGLSELKVQSLSKVVGISKSSFYHLFVDLDHFIESLLKFHLERSELIAKLELECKNIDPELIHILIEYKFYLLFNRQLIFHRYRKNFEKTLDKSNKIIQVPFISIWMKDLNLDLNENQTSGMFDLAIENFFSKIS